jgi:hypothetical protein
MKRWQLALLAGVMLLAIGCSKKPEMEIAAAGAAMTAAETAEAQDYAPAALQTVRDTMTAAQQELATQDAKMALMRKYDRAKELYITAARLAEEAGTQAQMEKERIRAEVEAELVSTRAAVDALTAKIAAAPKGKDNKADLELMKAEAASMVASLDEAAGLQTAGKYLQAQSKVKAVSTRVGEIEAELAKATAGKRK